MEKHPNTKPI